MVSRLPRSVQLLGAESGRGGPIAASKISRNRRSCKNAIGKKSDSVEQTINQASKKRAKKRKSRSRQQEIQRATVSLVAYYSTSRFHLVNKEAFPVLEVVQCLMAIGPFRMENNDIARSTKQVEHDPSSNNRENNNKC